MGLTTTTKLVDRTDILCGGSFEVTLSLTAEPDITNNPTDIVMLLDRSGSMTGAPLDNLKLGAKTFIDIIDESTDGTGDGQIGGGSRIGIVSFSTTSTTDIPLSTSVSDLKDAVDALVAGGNTNHASAFERGNTLFDDASGNARVIIMFTDGKTTAGPNPVPFADAAKAEGAVIYVIGLEGDTGIDIPALESWSSLPSSAYVEIAPTPEDLVEIFEDLARNISKPGATDIVLTDNINPCFRITSVNTPTKGTATLEDETTVRWNIDELGVTASEGAELSFDVEHIGPCSGLVYVNESIEYSDNEGNSASFQTPQINVDCGDIIITEECPEPVDFEVNSCEDTVVFDAGEINLESLGRIVEVDVTVKNVCPGKRVALAILLYELDDEDNEYKRGFKTLTIPAHDRDSCRDVLVRCIKFVLPEDLSLSGDTSSLCPERNLRTKFIANYIDNDFYCCEDINV